MLYLIYKKQFVEMNTYSLKILMILLLVANIKIRGQINNNLDESFQKLVEFISSEEFQKLKQNNSDLALVDSIYLRALSLSEGDISEGLLAATFATLPFDKMPIKLPFITKIVDLKLQEIDPVLFKKKNNNLPSELFFDTPSYGDKDKLAHFFGNAFLSYNISTFNISKILGIFVELFEESFKVSGGLDFRDLKVNYLGEFFGKQLNKNPKLLPSEVLSLYILLHLKIYN